MDRKRNPNNRGRAEHIMVKTLVYVIAFLMLSSSLFAQSYYFQTTFVTQAQNLLYFDLFNASGSGKKVQIVAITCQKNFAAVTGVAFQLDLCRTTAVGTGGTTITPLKNNTADGSIPAQITVRRGATGGATIGDVIKSIFMYSEETNVAAQAQESIPIWPDYPLYRWASAPLVLNEGEGIVLKQITNSIVGTYNTRVVFVAY